MRRIAAIVLVMCMTGVSAAEPVPTIAVDEIRAGMEGYGLSVFQGTQPDRFEVKVLSIIKDYFPHQDMILIRCAGQGLEHSGIVAGMSGSPIYLDGRLAGALAYGWGLAKDPIAGVTPIRNMLDELERPAARVGWTPPSGSLLLPCRSPVFFGGFAPRVVDRFAAEFEREALIPVQGGGGAGATTPAPAGARPFEPGSAVGVQRLRGDWNLTASGTVTWADGDRVLAFGHPFMGGGESAMPMTTAEIHLVLPLLSRSFKMGSPLASVGGMVQDRQSCIVGQIQDSPPMIPIAITVTNAATGHEEAFRFEAIRHKVFTAILVQIALMNAVEVAEAEGDDNTVETRLVLMTEGHGRIERTDYAYSPGGTAGTPPAQYLIPLFQNPWEEFRLNAVEAHVTVMPRKRFATIRGVRMAEGTRAVAGEKTRLLVELERMGGGRDEMAIEIPVPLGAAGQVLKTVIVGGGQAPLDTAAPDDLGDLIDHLRRQWRANQIVATVQGMDEFQFEIGGEVLKGLPLSAIGVLNPGSASEGTIGKEVFQTAVDCPWIVEGAVQFNIPVSPR